MSGYDFSLADAAAMEEKKAEKTEETKDGEEKKDEKLPLDMSLDEIYAKNKEDRRKDSPRSERSHHRHHERSYERPKYVNLDLSPRQVQAYVCHGDIDADGYDVKLRLVLTKRY